MEGRPFVVQLKLVDVCQTQRAKVPMVKTTIENEVNFELEHSVVELPRNVHVLHITNATYCSCNSPFELKFLVRCPKTFDREWYLYIHEMPPFLCKYQ